MNKAQQKKFDLLYQEYVNALHRQGKCARTIDGNGEEETRTLPLFASMLGV